MNVRTKVTAVYGVLPPEITIMMGLGLLAHDKQAGATRFRPAKHPRKARNASFRSFTRGSRTIRAQTRTTTVNYGVLPLQIMI